MHHYSLLSIELVNIKQFYAEQSTHSRKVEKKFRNIVSQCNIIFQVHVLQLFLIVKMQVVNFLFDYPCFVYLFQDLRCWPVCSLWLVDGNVVFGCCDDRMSRTLFW